jgi:ketosteroid isomerase-like protein
MSDLQAIADRVEIEALRGEFTDAAMMRDYDRLASLFTQDAVWRIPVVNVEFVGRDEIRAGIERLGEGLWDYLVQATHPGTIQLEGDTASGRAYVLSFGHMRDGSSHLNYSIYHVRWRAHRPRTQPRPATLHDRRDGNGRLRAARPLVGPAGFSVPRDTVSSLRACARPSSQTAPPSRTSTGSSTFA